MSDPILAVAEWPTNGDMMRDVFKLGYIKMADSILDATYGRGVFWSKIRPPRLVTNDIGKGTNPDYRFDFCRPPSEVGMFDHVVFDPPYKLNGTPTYEVDERYGVEVATTVRERMQLICDGLHGLAPICEKRMFVKCQDQVVSGKIVWQTRQVANVLESLGFRLEDKWDMVRWRKQPGERKQVHAGQNRSSLLILRRTTA